MLTKIALLFTSKSSKNTKTSSQGGGTQKQSNLFEKRNQLWLAKYLEVLFSTHNCCFSMKEKNIQNYFVMGMKGDIKLKKQKESDIFFHISL